MDGRGGGRARGAADAAPGPLAALVALAALVVLGLLSGAGRGAHARPLGGGALPPMEYGIEVDAESFAAELSATGARNVLVEFYLAWCPHCKHFRPEYDKAAAELKRRWIANGGEKIPALAIDCAVGENMRSVCSHFGIRGYPTMYYGAAEAFARYAERDADGAPHDGLRRVVPKGGPTAESVMAWLDENAAQDMPGGKSGAALGVLTGERGGRSGESGGDAERAAGAGGGGEGAGSGAVATDADVRGGRAGPKADGEEVPSVAGVTLRSAMDAALLRATQLVISNGFGSLADASEGHDPAARLSLVSFVALLADAHPLAECRKSAAALQHELPRLWPEGGSADAEALAHFDICGADAAIEAARADALEAAGGARRSWGVCEGSTPSSRGYTCGLWLLFHSLASRVAFDSGGAHWASAIGGYVQHFFECEACASHFTAMTKRRHLDRVRTRRDAVLWMWRAHNEVNARLREEEHNDGTGDPAFPKVQWPTERECADCRSSFGVDGWSTERVFAFLQQRYGRWEAAEAAVSVDADSVPAPLRATGLAMCAAGAAGAALWWAVRARRTSRGGQRRATGALMAASSRSRLF